MNLRGPLLPDGRTLGGESTLVMGILNVTPDSFSDGGKWTHVDTAIEHAHQMIAEGAALVDIGGESTGPGSTRIDTDEEWKRIGPVVSSLAEDGIICSVDTLHAASAVRAMEAGALIINDVSGGGWDPQMLSVVADTKAGFILQHYRALPGMPGEHFDYGPDLMATLSERLMHQVDLALDAGVNGDAIVIDPGLGFSLTNEQCWQIVRSLGELTALGYPILIGASRKRFIKATGRDVDEETGRVSVTCMRNSVWAVRVHNVGLNVAMMREGNEETR